MSCIGPKHGDCLDVLKTIPDCSVDAVVTDPPYGLSFMGRKWDYDVPSTEVWAECLRVLKPGGHLLAFFGTRTYHRGTVRIEDAGFEIRDMLGWLYGSGFPKSLDVSKAIDKAAGAEREVVSRSTRSQNRSEGWDRPWMREQMDSVGGSGMAEYYITAPATDAAQQWQGWGTALKPAHEPICLARKPLIGTVAENVLEHGTGALNIDGCRVLDGSESGAEKPVYTANHGNAVYGKGMGGGAWENVSGRWPANIIHDGSDDVLSVFPNQGEKSESRFFYCPKASKSDRGADNKHPTVKPTDLMRYLCRLITPPGGLILDPFMGSGSTGVAAILEGFRFIGIEREQEHFEYASKRIESCK